MIEDIILDIEDPINRIYSAANNFNSNEMFSIVISNDSSIRVIINSTMAGNFQIRSIFFSGGRDNFTVQCETQIISKILNAQFIYDIDSFIGKVHLLVTFYLADDYDNLIKFDEYLALKLTAQLNNEDEEYPIDLTLFPSRNTPTDEFSFRFQINFLLLKIIIDFY